MARRLKTIAQWINDWMAQDGYLADVVDGNRIIVKKYGAIVLDHNAAETYRTNSEVEEWLRKELWYNQDKHNYAG